MSRWFPPQRKFRTVPRANAIQQGILTKSTKERLEQLEAQRDELEQQIALEKMAKPKVSEDFIRFWLKRFQHLDTTKPEHRKMLIHTFVNAIYLYDDRAVIALNYKDGTKTVNFSEMERALTQRASASGSDLEFLSPPSESDTTHQGKAQLPPPFPSYAAGVSAVSDLSCLTT